MIEASKMKLLARTEYLFLSCSSIVLLLYVPQCESQNRVTRTIENAIVDIEAINNIVRLTVRKNDGTLMRNEFHTKYTDKPTGPLRINDTCDVDKICISNGNEIHTTITASSTNRVIQISRSVQNSEAKIVDCYDLGNGTSWFGGPQLRHQRWPVQHMYHEEEPYVPRHPMNMALAERYWLSGKGIYIYVSEEDPLFLDQNNYKDRFLCLVAKNGSPYRKRDIVTLDYEIGVFSDPRAAHENVIKNHFGKPTAHPNERMIKHPIWSTWARYKINVNKDVVVSFADEIVKNGFDNSQLEIDDNWETCYGSATFDGSKFPNITEVVEILKTKGFRVTLWIHPFINKGCEPAYSTALNNSYFVKSTSGEIRMQWWQGKDAAAIDFTNPKAVEWWIARLRRLQQAGIDSFKFDAGETSWLPQPPSLSGPLDQQPGIFTRDYVNTLANNFDDNIEVRVGWRSQNLSMFVRMIDKDTRWTWNNGLPTLITTLLQMNLNGYVYVLPDMIGGNGYLDNSYNATEYPSKELFIRWLQANVFMPSLQYSFVPWDYDEETVNISKKFTKLHAAVTPMILDLMKETIKSGAPLNPPIWWVDPTDEVAQAVNDEYLLGENVLVAPVTEEGAVSRDVYLPRGNWYDPNMRKVYKGPVYLPDYSAPLDVLPFFIQMKHTEGKGTSINGYEVQFETDIL